jgi:hypothetical protein
MNFLIIKFIFIELIKKSMASGGAPKKSKKSKN